MIPFLDLSKINARFEEQFKEQFGKFLKEGRYILGEQVESFEDQFASYCGVKYAIGVANGLDALRLILEAYKLMGTLKRGDGVLLAANSYIATVLAVKHVGLEPVFIEAEPGLFNMDTTRLPQFKNRVKAVIVTHLYGLLGPVDALVDFTEKNNLLLIEDASHAHGALREIFSKEKKQKICQKAGSFGQAAAFSFYPTKNLGALGDGGAVTTSDEDLNELLIKLRNYGTSSKYINDHAGFNSRLDEIQAAFLSVKLKELDQDNAGRREIAKRYLAEIKNPDLKLPFYDGSENHVFHIFAVLVQNRPLFLDHLHNLGIDSLIHYPVPPYRQDALKEYNSLSFPVTEKIANTEVSIPISPVMSEEQVTAVIDALNTYHA